MVVSEITLFNVLRAKLGEADAQKVVEGIKQTIKEEFENKKDVFLTKEDKVEIIEKIGNVKSEIIKWMFIFWTGTIAVLSGIIFAMLNAYLRH